MNGKIFVWLLMTALLTTAASSEAQQPTRIPRIGFLAGVSASTISARTDAFRQGLREHGYIEGKNIIIEWRYADEKLERLNELATELVRLRLDVLVSAAPTVTRPLRAATKIIPIVMAFDDDPVGNGFISSLAQPAGNITGLSNLAPEISGKQLELLREIVAKLARVAVLGTSMRPGNAQSLKEIELAALALGVKVQYIDVQDAKDIEAAFRGARKGSAGAVLVFGGPVFNSRREQLADLAVRNRLAAIYPRQEFVEEGGLMMYGPNVTDLYRRAATYVDRILKGAKPSDLPVEQPKKFEFIVNLKAAKQIGLTIPPNVLTRADRVIR